MRWIVVVVGIALALELVGFGLHACVWTSDRRERLVRGFAAKRRLVLDPDAARLAERLLVATRRGRWLGATVGIAGVGAAWWATHDVAARISVGAGLVVGMALFPMIPNVVGTLGAAVATRRSTPAAADRRLTHLPAPSLGDFLPPLMRWLPAALLAASGVAVGAALLSWPALAPEAVSFGRRDLVAAWVACLVAVAVTELTARVVVGMPRIATSPGALALQDEITGDLVLVVLHGALGPGLLLGLVGSAIAPAALVVGCWVGVVPALVEHRRQGRVRERLWAASPSTASASPTGGPDTP